MSAVDDPHAGQPVVQAGRRLGDGGAVVIVVHGRNAAPHNILELAGPLAHPALTWLAPAAAGSTWYPLSFLAERTRNEPFLASALRRLDSLVDEVVAAGIPRTRLVMMGFSQGACLATEFVATRPARYGGLVAFSGGLIGPPGTRWDADGSLDGTPAFFGCSDVDAHVPRERVEESARVLERMGAEVIVRIYAGMGHVVSDDELTYARRIVSAVADGPKDGPPTGPSLEPGR